MAGTDHWFASRAVWDHFTRKIYDGLDTTEAIFTRRLHDAVIGLVDTITTCRKPDTGAVSPGDRCSAFNAAVFTRKREEDSGALNLVAYRYRPALIRADLNRLGSARRKHERTYHQRR